jgi:predicted enzyme related to lactoylglutathione lyase
MPRPVHFEIQTPDPDGSMKFYEAVFGWKFSKWEGPEPYWLVSTGDGPGIDGGVMQSRDGQPRTVNTVHVSNVDDYSAKITESGGQIVVEKFAVPGVGYVAYATDPGGALFGIMHEDREAK